jgi:hypothetical protein
MIQRKRAGMSVPTERIAAPAPNVVSLMDALKPASRPKRLGNRRTDSESQEAEEGAAGQREMLLPIAGKGTTRGAAKDKAKEPARPSRSTAESWVTIPLEPKRSFLVSRGTVEPSRAPVNTAPGPASAPPSGGVF